MQHRDTTWPGSMWQVEQLLHHLAGSLRRVPLEPLKPQISHPSPLGSQPANPTTASFQPCLPFWTILSPTQSPEGWLDHFKFFNLRGAQNRPKMVKKVMNVGPVWIMCVNLKFCIVCWSSSFSHVRVPFDPRSHSSPKGPKVQSVAFFSLRLCPLRSL